MYPIGTLVRFTGTTNEPACFGVVSEVDDKKVIVTWPIPDRSGDIESWYYFDDEGELDFENDKIVFIKDDYVQ